jgi:hypothetical protein
MAIKAAVPGWYEDELILSPARRVHPVGIRRGPWMQDSFFPSQLPFASSMGLCRQAQPAGWMEPSISVSGVLRVTKTDLLLKPVAISVRCLLGPVADQPPVARAILTNRERPLSISR